MKNFYCFILVCCCSLPLFGQRNADYGIFAGIASYIGDINTSRLLYSPRPALGLFYRYNLHPRQALRANFFFGGFRADDADFNNGFQLARDASFSGVAGEGSVQFEFNFFPYSTEGKTWDFSPYLAAGVGVAYINTTNTTYKPIIPFSLGFKVNAYKNLGLEAEYGFRKTFYDNFDGQKDMVATSDYAWIHNNDWYSFLGVAVTWKIYNKLAGCPAFNDVDSKRKK
jgi:hypothetical protein